MAENLPSISSPFTVNGHTSLGDHSVLKVFARLFKGFTWRKRFAPGGVGRRRKQRGRGSKLFPVKKAMLHIPGDQSNCCWSDLPLRRVVTVFNLYYSLWSSSSRLELYALLGRKWHAWTRNNCLKQQKKYSESCHSCIWIMNVTHIHYLFSSAKCFPNGPEKKNGKTTMGNYSKK